MQEQARALVSNLTCYLQNVLLLINFNPPVNSKHLDVWQLIPTG